MGNKRLGGTPSRADDHVVGKIVFYDKHDNQVGWGAVTGIDITSVREAARTLARKHPECRWAEFILRGCTEEIRPEESRSLERERRPREGDALRPGG